MFVKHVVVSTGTHDAIHLHERFFHGKTRRQNSGGSLSVDARNDLGKSLRHCVHARDEMFSIGRVVDTLLLRHERRQIRMRAAQLRNRKFMLSQLQTLDALADRSFEHRV
jgi:hypothetical protein